MTDSRTDAGHAARLEAAGRTAPLPGAPTPPESGDGIRRPGYRMRRARSIAGVVFDALLVGTLVLALFVGYGLVNNRWYHVLAVQGGSMAPAIDPGDLIVVVRPPGTIEPGMILTLEVDGQVVTHRVAEVHPDGSFVTRGDANSVNDAYSSNRVRVVGQYAFRIPFLGNLLTLLHDPALPESGAWFADRAAVGGRALVAGGPAADACAPEAPTDDPGPELCATGTPDGGPDAPPVSNPPSE